MPFKKKKILAGVTFYLPPIDTGKQSLIAASGRASYDVAVKKILIFEDDEQASALLEQSFRAAGGFNVMTHHSSSRPIEKLRQFKPDAVILELKISPVSGWDVIKMIRHDRAYSKIAVILVSGHYKSVSDISAGLEDFCADGYVLKPFSGRVMVALVKSILR
ncbi:MAG: response regulator, partial [Endomicrobiia bacterium]|nr:response regulator [Endomicrobiia bacterium]